MVKKLETSHFAAYANGRKISPDAARGRPIMLKLMIGDGEDYITVILLNDITIGRSDNELHVEVDLTPYHAQRRGVSRQHVKILRRDDQIYIQDLRSTNGTRMNGQTLEPGRAYELHGNENLVLGQFPIQIHIIRKKQSGKLSTAHSSRKPDTDPHTDYKTVEIAELLNSARRKKKVTTGNL